MNQSTQCFLIGLTVGTASGIYVGYTLGMEKKADDLRSKITLASVNQDIVKWVAEVGITLPSSEFYNELNERLNWLDIVRHNLQEDRK